jgi:hypothetical protein
MIHRRSFLGKIRGTIEDKVSAFRDVPYGASTAGAPA